MSSDIATATQTPAPDGAPASTTAAPTAVAYTITPRMTPLEIACFEKHVAGAKRYLEFGCGGSTCVAGHLRIPKIVSIESDANWIAKCRLLPELQGLDVDLIHVDVGPAGKWGMPRDGSHARKWPDYYTSVWSTLAESPDVVLIDGRWRVACALQSLLRTEPQTKILIHDFWRRPHYHVVLNFCDVVESIDTLAVLRARSSVDWKALALASSQHAMDFL